METSRPFPLPDPARTDFPPDFLFGAATAAFQIEGAWDADGKGESNWDRWCHLPGKIAGAKEALELGIAGGATGDVAVDHYHRWREDVDLMAGLGLGAYRFSISWSRVRPGGRGAWNAKGLEFYDRLVDALLEKGIRPFATFHHYEIPQALEDAGGWTNRDMPAWFADFAEGLAKRYGDRIRHWMTINEPICVAEGHYAQTIEPPGLGDPQAGAQAGHHLLLGHGLALRALKSVDPGLQGGMVCNLYPMHAYRGGIGQGGSAGPRSMVSEDRGGEGLLEAWTEEEMSLALRLADGKINRWWLDPIYHGRYPQEYWDYRTHKPEIRPGDMEAIAFPPDFLGLNYYHRMVVRPGRWGGRIGFAIVSAADLGLPHTTMGWEIYPEGLREILARLKAEYRDPAVYVTESGMAQADSLDPDGRVRDPYRIEYLRGHFRQAALALRDGARLRGYFVWSLLDNFEWEAGWGQRFGLVHVDYRDLRRRPKDSALWLRDFLRGAPAR